MKEVIVIGGGWAGVAAAIEAKKCGAKVTIIEKTDLLLGLGNVGGIMRNNGRYTAAEENIALGAGELFEITDRLSTHKDVNFPGHSHGSFYNVTLVEPEVRRLLNSMDIEVRMMTRAIDVVKKAKDKIRSIVTAQGEELSADVFVEATGSTGPMGNCMKYGNGCSMCILRCPTFGPRVSITECAGLDDFTAQRSDGSRGAFSGSCKIDKKSLSDKLQKKLKRYGFAVIPLPVQMINREKLDKKVCRQYALDEFAENMILIDTGYAKLMTSYFNIEELRQIEGFENARYIDPYGGSKGNSVRYMSVGVRDKYMKAVGIENLFLAGEKSGFLVGHTEAISTGTLAGYNAVMYAQSKPLLHLPQSLAIGDLLHFSNKVLLDDNDTSKRFTFSGGEYFERMKEKNLYCTDAKKIREIVKGEGLLDIYNGR